MRRLLIIPAAGRGSRLGGSTPKPFVHVDGRPMLDHLAALYRPVVDHIAVVAHPSFAGDVARWGARYGNVSVAQQLEPTGMLDAILEAAPIVRRERADWIWITWADQVATLPQTVQMLADVTSAAPPPALALPTVRRRQPYTHFARDPGGRITRLLQKRENDAMPPEGESDMGLFALARETYDTDLAEYARDVPAGHATGERNFVPFVPWLAARRSVVTFPCTHPMEAIGINTPDDLREVEAWLRTRS